MSHANDVKNAELVFEKFGKKKLSKEDKAKILRKETNWAENKIQSVLKTIESKEQTT